MQFCFELWISLESQCPYPLYTTVIMLLQWYPEDSWDKNLSLAHSHILTTYLLNVVSHLSFVTKTNWSHYYQILRNSKYFKASELFHTDPHQMYSLVCKITHTILITFSFWIYIKSTWVCTLNHQHAFDNNRAAQMLHVSKVWNLNCGRHTTFRKTASLPASRLNL